MDAPWAATVGHTKMISRTNQYRATYTAPAGAPVSLRVTAHDTHGASVTETILGAYRTG
jgi:hypothetical protein